MSTRYKGEILWDEGDFELIGGRDVLAVICLFAPALIWFFVRSVIFPTEKKGCRWMHEYLLCFLLLNGGIFALLRAFFKIRFRPFYYLNRSPRFAVKYIALVVAMLIIELAVERLFRTKINQKCRLYIKKLPAPLKKGTMLLSQGCQNIWSYVTVWCEMTSRSVKVVIFSAGLVAFLCLLGISLQPLWGYVESNSTHGIYKEKKNTIQTLFMGSSHVYCGISPMELYERYGICSYDLSTGAQPLAASYVWLREVYRYQQESLDIVVLDVSMLMHDPKSALYHVAIDPMHFSINKIHGVKSYSVNFNKLLMNTFSTFTYHERWKELSHGDFVRFNHKPQLFLRGYNFKTSQWINGSEDFSKIVIPVRILDKNAEEIELNGKTVKYFSKIVSFCREHDLRLLLIKVPTGWSSAFHNAVQSLADKYGLDFLDFNIEPYYSDINFNLAADVLDTKKVTNNLHLNYYGATKLTDYLGKYLTEKYGARDIRGDPKYAFMDEYLDDYHRHIIDATLMQFTDPCDYIKYALDLGQYTIFISARDDAAHALTDEQRNYFASIGLPELSGLKDRASYLAVIDDGKVKKEMTKKDSGNNVAGNPISYVGKTSDKTAYKIASGGRNSGDTSSITIRGAERSPNKRGLNIVLYDNKMHKFAASAVFDTHAAPLRPIQNVEQRLKAELEAGATLPELSGVDRQLYLYNRRCDCEMKKALARNAARENNLPSYLTEFLDDEKLEIYLAAKNDGTLALTDESRERLRVALPKLVNLSPAESYVAVITGGKVTAEKTSQVDEPLEIRTDKYLLRSGKRGLEDISTLMFDGKNYMDETDGLHVLIYDTLTQLIVDNVTFGARTAEEVAQ